MIKRFFVLIICFSCIFPMFSQNENMADTLIRKGVELHDKKQYTDAIKCYQKALSLDSTSMYANYELSLSYLKLKKYDKAIEYSTKIIASNFQPLLMDAYIVKSTAYANTNDLDSSIKLLNQALERCGNEYVLHFNLGLSYFNKNQDTKAIEHLRKAIELDVTHPSAFLLYAYALNDAGYWVESFYAFHFFLLLEPNTARSKDAFHEMFGILNKQFSDNSEELQPKDGVDRRSLYKAIQQKKQDIIGEDAQYTFFREASKTIFFRLGQIQNDTQNGLLWDFFVPTYEDLLESGHFNTYCRYVSAAYFQESITWWNQNKMSVDQFIDWFKNGQTIDHD